MKLLVLLLVLFQAQQQNVLTADQVLAWRTYYGLPLDKDVSEALKVLGDAIPHVVIERLLFGIQFGRRNDGQAHLSNSG